jgi:hypothetical protein
MNHSSIVAQPTNELRRNDDTRKSPRLVIKIFSLLLSAFARDHQKVNRAVNPNASGTKFILGIISSSGFQSSERLIGAV